MTLGWSVQNPRVHMRSWAGHGAAVLKVQMLVCCMRRRRGEARRKLSGSLVPELFGISAVMSEHDKVKLREQETPIPRQTPPTATVDRQRNLPARSERCDHSNPTPSDRSTPLLDPRLAPANTQTMQLVHTHAICHLPCPTTETSASYKRAPCCDPHPCTHL